MAGGAAETGVDQERADIGGVEQEPSVSLGRPAPALSEDCVLFRLARKKTRQVAKSASIDHARGEVRSHRRIAALAEVEPETGRVERSRLAPQRMAVVIEK